MIEEYIPKTCGASHCPCPFCGARRQTGEPEWFPVLRKECLQLCFLISQCCSGVSNLGQEKGLFSNDL